MIFLGIDPGIEGAVAWMKDEEDHIQPVYRHLPLIHDTPVLIVKKNRREYDVAAMVHCLPSGEDPVHVFVEKSYPMPKQGVHSVFSFGYGFGLWIGILGALKIPYTLVHPVRWKKVMLSDLPKGKDSSRLRAQQLFPSAELHLKKHHGRAEALLLAEYGRRLLRKEHA